MVFDYLITLKKKNEHLIDWLNYLLFFLAVGFFLRIIIVANQIKWHLIIYIIIMTGFVFYNLYLQKIKNEIPYYRIVLGIAIFGWLSPEINNVWIAALYFILALIEKQVKFPYEIGYNEEWVVINSLPKKKYKWTEINNTLIKDGLLTLDLVNNKLIQREIEEGCSSEIEKEFNSFCFQQLNKNPKN